MLVSTSAASSGCGLDRTASSDPRDGSKTCESSHIYLRTCVCVYLTVCMCMCDCVCVLARACVRVCVCLTICDGLYEL